MDDFQAAVQRLLAQVSHWEAARWGAAAGTAGCTRGDLLHGLVQRLADLGAAAENRRQRPVPRLADTILADQVRVMADDLLAAGPPDETLAEAAEAISTTRASL
ncbi:hypothetical protein ACFQFC_19405 [Amorphoplanes digitatis]|uniref:Uncharacterized protein n=1 Tax=Actinoplanes digitatis TaxID=1868 RepID=A0A7W7MTG7_9ACTN|nr:hypothetical protein [Actinoplanes digitatis]MBB4766386.1 hypothetical protein [Actinoplanes digitatis]GID96091.1 hypothetical protein Adi01nite_55030 [Actinoplanes digitatis]